MPSLFTVKYSPKADLQVYLDAIWKPIWTDYGLSKYEIGQKYFPKEFLDSLKNAKSKKEAESVVRSYWKQIRPKNFTQNTKLIVKWFNRFLSEEQNLIINKLETTYRQPFPFNDIKVYLTTFFSCPYNYRQKWFMVGRAVNIFGLLSISVHELNHFMFYYYYARNLKDQGFGETQIEYLKEALSVLTSNDPKENINKPNVLPIQDFIRKNNKLPISRLIDKIIQNQLITK